MSLLTELSDLVGSAFGLVGIDPALGEVVRSQRPELGDFQCNGALAAGGRSGRPPVEVAREVAALVSDDPRIAAAGVAGPGFINLTVSDRHLAAVVGEAAADHRLGVARTERPKKVVVDYGGPNVAKELHVGHLRPAVIGDSLKRIYRFVGHEALGDVHLGDWGAPMGQLIAEMEERFPELPYFDPTRTGPYPSEPPVTIEHLQDMYPVAAGKAKTDPAFAERARLATVALQEGRPGYVALWEHFRAVSIAALRAVYTTLGVEFDLWLGEASVHDRIPAMIERLRRAGAAVESEGALVVEVARPEDRQPMPPLILVNSRGGYTYATTDLATVEQRVVDLGAEELVYVVDLRQSLHFEQVFRAAYATGIAGPQVVFRHAGNGTVNGPDGRPFKTREGGLPRLRDLVEEVVALAHRRLKENDLAETYPEEERQEIARRVGLAALKFGDLVNHRASSYSFDPERFTLLQGKTGPYIQYVTTRCRSILRKAEEAGLEGGAVLAARESAERALQLELTRLPEVIERVLELEAPNHLAEHAFALAGVFNRFYDACHVLTEPDPARRASWLMLVDTTRRTLSTLLDLLGIEVPERM